MLDRVCPWARYFSNTSIKQKQSGLGKNSPEDSLQKRDFLPSVTKQFEKETIIYILHFYFLLKYFCVRTSVPTPLFALFFNIILASLPFLLLMVLVPTYLFQKVSAKIKNKFPWSIHIHMCLSPFSPPGLKHI